MKNEELQKWEGVYSIAVDQLCKAAGIRELPSPTAATRPFELEVSASVTRDELRAFLVKALLERGFTALWLAPFYILRGGKAGDGNYLSVVLHGEYP